MNISIMRQSMSFLPLVTRGHRPVAGDQNSLTEATTACERRSPAHFFESKRIASGQYNTAHN